MRIFIYIYTYMDIYIIYIWDSQYSVRRIFAVQSERVKMT